MSVSSRPSKVAIVAALVAGVGLFDLSCGGGGGSPSSGSTPPVTIAPQPTPTPSTGGGTGATCTLGKGDVNAECAKTSSKLLAAVLTAMDLLVQQKPQLFDKSDEFGSGTSPVQSPRQGRLPERPHRQPDRGGISAPSSIPTTRTTSGSW